jgi:hypothetical protein
MTENAPKVCLNDIMSVLSDPAVVPSLEAEREALAGRLAQIDRMLAILRPQPPSAQNSVDTSNRSSPPIGAIGRAACYDPEFVRRVLASMRQGLEYRTIDIAKAVYATPRDVYAALSLLRVQEKVDSCGGRGPGTRWFLKP